MHAAPVYIAEIAPAEVRGTLVSAKDPRPTVDDINPALPIIRNIP